MNTNISHELFNLDAEITKLIEEHVDPETGEISEESLETLVEIEGDREFLLLQLARYYKSCLATEQMIKEVVAERAKKARAWGAKAATAFRAIDRFMEPGAKLGDELVDIGWRKSTYVDVKDLEAALQVAGVPQPDKLDKRLLGELIKAHEVEPEVATIETRQNLQVK